MSEKHDHHRGPKDKLPWHPQSQMMSYGYDPFLSEGSVKPPVFLTSTFAFRSAEEGAHFFDVLQGRVPLGKGEKTGLVYSRFNHPNLQIAEDRLALLDGSQAAVITSSGMAAISSVLLTFLQPGMQIVQSAPIYGGTETLIARAFKKWQVDAHEISDALSVPAMTRVLETAAAAGRVGLCYIETPCNPTNALVDFLALQQALDIFERQHGYRPITVCDNTMLGPVFQKPVEQGIDLCVYSLTKYVGGHSDLVAGGVTGPKELVEQVRMTRGAYGMQLDPHSAWMMMRSMETVVLRMQQAARTARRVADWLQESGQVSRVYHPELLHDDGYQEVYKRQCSGPGSTFSFELKGGREQAFAFINALRLFKSAVSLGGTESLICHPASTTHSGVPEADREATGVTQGLIRVSIGLEHEDDLIADMKAALQALDG